jgi:cytochrome P450
VLEVVDDHLIPFVERLRDGQTVDAVQHLTRHIPTMVIARMMGIPTADHQQFALWSDRMGDIIQGMQDRTPRGEQMVRDGRRASAELNAYLREAIAHRRSARQDDLIGHMVDSPIAHDHMTDGEVVASNSQLVFAGNETTAKLMSHILLALALHPDVREELRQDRSLIPQAVEEIHRWNTVSQVAWRTVRRADVTVGGHRLEPGSEVMLLKGAANRDPARWDSPGNLDIHRPARGHLGFGFGMHSCLGLNLARLEVQIWLERLLDELPAWDVIDIDWGVAWTLRGPTQLSIRRAY